MNILINQRNSLLLIKYGNKRFTYKNKIKELLYSIDSTKTHFIDNLKDDIINNHFKNNTSYFQSELDFNFNCYSNFIHDLYKMKNI